MLVHHRGWNAKVGNQEIPEVTGKFGHVVQNGAGQRLTVLSRKTPFSNNPKDDSTHGHHQMVNIKIRLIMFFSDKDEKALYSQQKQDQKLTVVPYFKIQA